MLRHQKPKYFKSGAVNGPQRARFPQPVTEAVLLWLAGVFLFFPKAVGSGGQQRAIPPGGYRDWKVYSGAPDSIHYSALDQINTRNVGKLEVAWTYETGDAFPGSEMECNPIVVKGSLYATTPKLRVIALDAASGGLKWSFDPNAGRRVLSKMRNRGVTYWEDGEDQRIFAVVRHYLYALDARTGKLITGFGQGGLVDLREGLGRDPQTLTISATSPGIVYKDVLILGSLVSETLPGAPGDIRAYDVRSGKLRWIFHTIPHPGEFGYDTWPKDGWKYLGGANNWAGMSLDVERGLVFASTGSAAFDFYGSNRIGDNLFANCVLALKAATGERVWHFQGVRHDVWDRDFPAPPSLVTIRRDGRLVDAVSQTTKSGYVFVFDRETGKPLFPIEYRKVPPSDVDGEVLAETQPFPLLPPPFARQRLTEDIVTRRTAATNALVLARLRQLRNGGQFTPPSREGSIVFPGFDGGAEWGGTAFDPETGLLYVNSNEMAWVLRLVERPKAKERLNGRELYVNNCASCHRTDLRGTPPEFPSLIRIGDKFTEPELRRVIREGEGRMPGFTQLGPTALSAIVGYLVSGEQTEVRAATAAPSPIDQEYTFDGYNKFLDADGYPAIETPWGTLNAINLDTGKIFWNIPFGEFPALAQLGLRNTGSENYGGAVVTAGGLLFIGATIYDSKFHAFDKMTGKLLWEATLPVAGNATPATYEVNGRQIVVIAAGGGKWGAQPGANYVAFALPESETRRSHIQPMPAENQP